MTSTPTPAAGHGALNTQNQNVTKVPGSGRGSYVVGFTVLAIAGFAIVSLLTSISSDNIRWFAPLALVVAGVLALARRC